MSTESFDEKLQRVKHLCQYLKDRKIVITDDRKEWLQVMFALRELGTDGYDLFQKLSAESTTKYDEKECKRQWDKMQSQPTGQDSAGGKSKFASLPCTLGTLYHLAEQHGANLTEVAREWYQQHPELQHPELQPPSPEEQKALLRAQAEARARQQQEAEQAERERRLHPDVIDSLWVKRTYSASSTLMRSLVERGILTPEQMMHAVQQYRIGALKDGGIIYWYIDQYGRTRDGKLMWYGPDCHRLKDDKGRGRVSWMGARMRSGKAPYLHPDTRQPLLPASWRQTLCLFGQHLLPLYPDRPVAIVESEKTAIICSELLADRGYIWLATGGKQQLRPESFEPLFGRSVTVFPDTDPTGETFHAWQQVAHQAQRFTQRVIRVQEELERVATPDQRQRKIDIADLLTEPQIQQFQLSAMRRAHPVLAQLISMFHLQLPNS